MNAVEIADAVSTLMEPPFDRDNFPFAFLEAFGNKETTLKKLRSGDSNKSDLGGVLQRSNFHRDAAGIRPWANVFPYVNGGLFGKSGSADVPVGMANEKANDKAVNDTSLAPHSHANEDVGSRVPRHGHGLVR